VSKTSLSTSGNVFRTGSSRSNTIPSHDASSDDARPTHKLRAFTLVVVHARLCVHAASEPRTAEGSGRMGPPASARNASLVIGRNPV